MDDLKAYYAMVAVLFIAMYGSIGYHTYSENSCKVELAKANRTVEEINKLCK